MVGRRSVGNGDAALGHHAGWHHRPGYEAGLSFIQFYFGLPIAMVILSLTVVPFFRRANVYTAYEYLERRFDSKTRLLTSLLFLFSRAMATWALSSPHPRSSSRSSSGGT